MSPAPVCQTHDCPFNVSFLLDGKSRAGTDDTTEEITKTLYYSSIYKILSSYYSLSNLALFSDGRLPCAVKPEVINYCFMDNSAPTGPVPYIEIDTR